MWIEIAVVPSGKNEVTSSDKWQVTLYAARKNDARPAPKDQRFQIFFIGIGMLMSLNLWWKFMGVSSAKYTLKEQVWKGWWKLMGV